MYKTKALTYVQEHFKDSHSNANASWKQLIPGTLTPEAPFRKRNYRRAVWPRQLSITETETKKKPLRNTQLAPVPASSHRCLLRSAPGWLFKTCLLKMYFHVKCPTKQTIMRTRAPAGQRRSIAPLCSGSAGRGPRLASTPNDAVTAQQLYELCCWQILLQSRWD